MKECPIAHKFTHIKRHEAREANRVIARIKPGEYYVTQNDEIITTILGSCISTCLHDPVLKVGGMNHFLLPYAHETNSEWTQPDVSATNRYGNFAMEALINDLLKLGARKDRLQVKVFGGGKMTSTLKDVGANNIRFIRSYLSEENMPITSEDLGQEFPRKVKFYPASGRVQILKLQALHNSEIAREEEKLAHCLDDNSNTGNDAELF